MHTRWAAHEFVEVPLLTTDEAFGLISLVRGERYNSGRASQWPASLREAVRRPLFAIRLGAFLRSRGPLAGFPLGEVLSALVERAIENTSLERRDAERLLLQLASLSNDRSGRAVPVREVATRTELHPLLQSRLVVERAGSLQFPLALLREWYGAQRLITDAAFLNGIGGQQGDWGWK
jgi:hypothetical protein